MIRRPPRSTPLYSSAASDVYKRQGYMPGNSMCRVTSIIGLRTGLIDMCGRFALDENPRKLAEHFLLSGEAEFSPSWNIAPSLLSLIHISEPTRRTPISY